MERPKTTSGTPDGGATAAQLFEGLPRNGSDRDRIRALPKAELHVHLDGSLRASTLLQLAPELSYVLPALDADALARRMTAPENGDLVSYLSRFELTVGVLQSAEALERVAFELAVDAAHENVRYIEVRFAPILCTRKGLSMESAIEATIHGLRRAEAAHTIRTALIISALRQRDPRDSEASAEVAAAFIDRGVVGFDLAGPERGHPAGNHAAAFDRARDAGLGITVHAGEAAGPKSIRQAIEQCHAQRIGHGTALIQAPDLLATVRDSEIAVEACITSNVQTGAIKRRSDHPAPRYLEEGITTSLSTDNRLVSGTTMTREFEVARDDLGLDWDALVRLARAGFESAFLPDSDKYDLLEAFDAEVAQLASAPG